MFSQPALQAMSLGANKNSYAMSGIGINNLSRDGGYDEK